MTHNHGSLQEDVSRVRVIGRSNKLSCAAVDDVVTWSTSEMRQLHVLVLSPSSGPAKIALVRKQSRVTRRAITFVLRQQVKRAPPDQSEAPR